MSTFLDYGAFLFEVAPLLSALPIAVAMLVQQFEKYLISHDFHFIYPNYSVSSNENLDKLDWEGDTRLFDARQAMEEQVRALKWNRRTENYLKFGHYIIGGVLATSFVQSSLSTTSAGFLGVLVLMSSLIHQHYRPDVKANNALDRSLRLKQLIREGEDLVFDMKRKNDDQSITKVRQLISKKLADIERSELNYPS